MSKEPDDLLKTMNDAKGDRQESDIPLNDKEPYWIAREAYQRALHKADGVHIPVVKTEAELKGEEQATLDELKDKEELTEAEKQLKSIGL